jgi:hypothetical protein
MCVFQRRKHFVGAGEVDLVHVIEDDRPDLQRA